VSLATCLDEQTLDLPVLVPGLNRVYSNRVHAILTGLTGRLAVARGEIWGAGFEPAGRIR
jgi:hypothetical protein